MTNNTNKTTKIAIAMALAIGIAAAAPTSDGQDHPPVAAVTESERPAVPDAFPLSRYEGLWKNSLFAPGKAPVAKAAPSNLSLVGVFEVDGVEHAVLMDTSNGMTEEINNAGTSASGSRLAKIESSPDLMKTRVQVERGGSLIWVGYNLGATAKAPVRQANANRPAVTAPVGSGSVGKGEIIGGTDQPDSKAERPRTVVLPSTIPMKTQPK